METYYTSTPGEVTPDERLNDLQSGTKVVDTLV